MALNPRSYRVTRRAGAARSCQVISHPYRCTQLFSPRALCLLYECTEVVMLRLPQRCSKRLLLQQAPQTRRVASQAVQAQALQAMAAAVQQDNPAM